MEKDKDRSNKGGVIIGAPTFNNEKPERPYPDFMNPENDATLLSDNFNNNASRNYTSDRDRSVGREALAKMLMKEREPEYTTVHDVIIYCATWNIAERPVISNLGDWLMPPQGVVPDIYFVGMQEIDMTANAYFGMDGERETLWLNSMKNNLCPSASYDLIAKGRMMGILVGVFVKRGLDTIIHHVHVSNLATGLLNRVGNKGAVAVSLTIRDTSVCFVNSHLAAHTEDYERRNQDFRDISSKLQFDDKMIIPDHDIVFWLGDLNYRISDIDTSEVNRHLSNNSIQPLLNFDQLHRGRLLQQTFQDYQEGDITFKPTYKFDIGTTIYVPGRTPAWCDRILYRGSGIKQFAYRSHPNVRHSDHVPVSSVFQIPTKTHDVAKEERIHSSVMKLLDQKENEYLPQISLSTIEVSFKDMKFLDHKHKSVTIVNIGQVPARFSFATKPAAKAPFKSWLNVQPANGVLLEGESMELLFEVVVNSKTMTEVDGDRMEDILVLHLHSGKDFFITVTAELLPSFFGIPLNQLVAIHSPVGVQNEPTSNSFALGVPKELWFLIDYLYKRGMNQEELFQILGLETEIKLIRDILDSSLTGLTASRLHIHSVAECLLIFLDSLPEPVVPYSFYQDCINTSSPGHAVQVVHKFPKPHENVFKYVCAFLREYLTNKHNNRSDIRILAHVFGGVLLKAPSWHKGSTMVENNLKTNFVQHFLTHAFD